MTALLLEQLRASVLLEAMREIEEIAGDESDITNNGGPNAAMKIAQIARSAIAQVRNVDERPSIQQRTLIIANMLRETRDEGIATGIDQAKRFEHELEKAS